MPKSIIILNNQEKLETQKDKHKCLYKDKSDFGSSLAALEALLT